MFKRHQTKTRDTEPTIESEVHSLSEQNGLSRTEERHACGELPHGSRCDCALLAQALHLDPRTISYRYCRNVLQRHWSMTCRHGETRSVPAVPPIPRGWKPLSELTPVDAILLENTRHTKVNGEER